MSLPAAYCALIETDPPKATNPEFETKFEPYWLLSGRVLFAWNSFSSRSRDCVPPRIAVIILGTNSSQSVEVESPNRPANRGFDRKTCSRVISCQSGKRFQLYCVCRRAVFAGLFPRNMGRPLMHISKLHHIPLHDYKLRQGSAS
jgi:hypothetical protein